MYDMDKFSLQVEADIVKSKRFSFKVRRNI